MDSQESGEAYNVLKIRLESSHYKSSGAACSQFARHTKNTVRPRERVLGNVDDSTRIESNRVAFSGVFLLAADSWDTWKTKC